MSEIDDIVRLHVHGTLDPADSLGSFISENSAIVRELAERGPFIGDTGCCETCAVGPSLTWRALQDSVSHEPTCLWRRARALYPGR